MNTIVVKLALGFHPSVFARLNNLMQLFLQLFYGPLFASNQSLFLSLAAQLHTVFRVCDSLVLELHPPGVSVVHKVLKYRCVSIRRIGLMQRILRLIETDLTKLKEKEKEVAKSKQKRWLAHFAFSRYMRPIKRVWAQQEILECPAS